MKPDGDWIRTKAFELASGQSFLGVAVSVEQLRALAAFGGSVVGAVLVVPDKTPDVLPDEAIPTLTLRSIHSNIFDHVVRDFGSALSRYADRVSEFLESCDPRGEAIVVSTLPIPHRLFGARKIWAQNDQITRPLEKKSALPGLLEGVLPTVKGATESWPCQREVWESLVQSYGTKTLVVQDPGLSGGGAGTWMADDWERAIAIVKPSLEAVRITGFVPGTPCNVSGVVVDADQTIVFPPSIQIIGMEPEGSPVYAGNILGDDLFNTHDVADIRSEVKRFGTRIASAGFRGPFGLDFIHASAKSRLYHDINPRMNGVIDSLSQYLAADGASPLLVLLYSHSDWHCSEVERLERNFDEFVHSRPHWRFFLSRLIDASWSEARPPIAGRWRIETSVPSATRVGPVCGLDELSDDEAILLSTLVDTKSYRTGERLVLGDMLCGPSLGAALSELHGSSVAVRLFDGFFG